MMYYKSTRGSKETISSAEAIKRGIAPDGGLYLPSEIPFLSDSMLKELVEASYLERAAEILSLFLADAYTKEELLEDCRAAYAEARFPGGAAPVSKVGEKLRVLELWHGPTCAFKDMALQLMPRLLSRALVKTGEKRDALILVATSGDTGKAALEGYRDVPRIRILVYYPRDGVSTVQKLQMATQEGGNVYVRSVRGNFDDAQSGVKAIFADPDAAEKLNAENCFLSSANSINWGRLVPQIVYYISAYCDLVNAGDIRLGEEINVTVPTGNFGDILAGYIAKEMGLPIHTLVCASNGNNVLTDFFDTGVYDRNRPFQTTMSPSMDILISSNLERLLALRLGCEKTVSCMKQLKDTGRYALSEEDFRLVRRSLFGLCCSEAETEDTIRMIWDRYHYLCDTHTAVGVKCALEYQQKEDDKRLMLALSTASPYKFAPAVCHALCGEQPEQLKAPSVLAEMTGLPIPAPIAGLAGRPVRFDPAESIAPEEMKDAMMAALRILKQN